MKRLQHFFISALFLTFLCSPSFAQDYYFNGGWSVLGPELEGDNKAPYPMATLLTTTITPSSPSSHVSLQLSCSEDVFFFSMGYHRLVMKDSQTVTFTFDQDAPQTHQLELLEADEDLSFLALKGPAARAMILNLDHKRVLTVNAFDATGQELLVSFDLIGSDFVLDMMKRSCAL